MAERGAPVGYDDSIRALATDRSSDEADVTDLERMRAAATDGSLDVLVLSAGGYAGAFGAGALVGLSHAATRREYEIVTGVSAGALVAPFAFLGQSWDQALTDAATGPQVDRLKHSGVRRFIDLLLSPFGGRSRGALFGLVDHLVTNEMVAAVARESSRGKKLLVATTDLDRKEAVIWDMGAIASRSDERARELFRDVLVASASVPGVFPPVLLTVSDGTQTYDELHVDGGITTPIFGVPPIPWLLRDETSDLSSIRLDVLMSEQLAVEPQTTKPSTLKVLNEVVNASYLYLTRSTLVALLDFADEHNMDVRIAEIPRSYRLGQTTNFSRAAMQRIFDYAVACAEAGHLWQSPESVLEGLTTSELAADSSVARGCAASQ